MKENNKSVLIVGDLHWKEKEPYKKKIKEFLNDLYEKYPNDYIIFTGDFFDKANPHAEREIDEILEIVTKWHFVIVVTGNHEVSYKYGNILVPLQRIKNFLVCHSEPMEVIIDDYNFVLFPYLYEVNEMKKYETFKPSRKVDIVVAHCAYPGTNFGNKDEIDLSGIEAKHFFYGHIHQPMDFENHHIIGVPCSTRYGEQIWQKRIVRLPNKNDGSFEYIPLKEYVTFENIEFGNYPKDKDSILDIYNVPNVSLVNKKYKDYYVRFEGIRLLENEKTKTYNETKDFLNFSLENLFNVFLQENPLEKPIVERIKSLLHSNESDS